MTEFLCKDICRRHRYSAEESQVLLTGQDGEQFVLEIETSE